MKNEREEVMAHLDSFARLYISKAQEEISLRDFQRDLREELVVTFRHLSERKRQSYIKEFVFKKIISRSK
jgi:hypothetical protein